MAYTQNPGGPVKQKTGHGIPPAFIQDAETPVKQMKAIKNLYNKGKELVTDIGDKIYRANEAGVKAFDEGVTADDFATGSGMKRSYKKDGLDYVSGFVNSLVSPNPKTNEKKKTVTRQMKPKASMAKKKTKGSAAKMKSC